VIPSKTQIRLPLRKSLCARLLFFDAARVHPTLKSQPAYKSLAQMLVQKSNHLALESDDLSLDSSVQQVYRQFAETTRAEPSWVSLLPLVERARNEALALKCVAPLEDRTRTCDQCRCLGPLEEMAHAAFQCAADYHERYSSFAELFRDAARASLRERCSWTTDPPSLYRPMGGRAAFNVGGTTRFDTDEKNAARIHFALHEQKLTESESEKLAFHELDFQALRYVMFHEIVCHAFQGLAVQPLRRQATVEQDRFAEGWMDDMVYRILRELHDGIGLGPPLSYSEWRASEGFHRDRLEFADWPLTYQQGAAQARYYEQYVYRRTNSADRARKELFRCSFDLNLLRGSNANPYPPYQALEQLFSGEPMERSPVAMRKLRVVDRYLEGGGPAQFIDDLAQTM
jgi:hypothetical protein